MKVNIIRFSAFVLILAGSFYSCAKKAESSGEVPYKPCPCDEGKSMQAILTGNGDQWTLQIESYLFNGYPSPEVLSRAFPDEIEPFSFRFTYFIVINSENDLVWIKEAGHMHAAVGRICNFPDFAKEWDIPEEGLKIYFEGSFYESCVRKPYDAYGVGGDEDLWPFFSYDFVLTHLKRR